MSATDHLESAEFRLHIRNLLYEYSITHYTTNYATFTEDLVAEFLERLKPVPLTDPYSFVIPVDPFQTFYQIHSLSSLQPYDEIPQTTNDARLYLKSFMGSKLGTPKTERLKWTDDIYEPPPEPFIPALTRHARKQTPKLGKKAKPACPESYQNLLESQKINSIHVEPIEEEKLIPEEILQTKLHIDPKELPAVKAILQTTADMMRPQRSYKNKCLDPTFLCKEPSTTYKLPEEVFMPMFPRSRVPGSGTGNAIRHIPGLKSFADIPSVVTKKVDVEDPDPDIFKQNLVIVDGWETIRSSPPSTPSQRGSDDEDQLDQLFLASSPNTEPPLVEEIEKAKMEEIQIPRSRQIGGSSGITPHILAGKTLQSFLQPLLSQTKTMSRVEPKTAKANHKDSDQTRSSPTPSSLVGQPASELEDRGTCLNKPLSKPDIQELDLDTELKMLYEGHGLEDMIMNETIDEKQDMLWEVPDLPGPNVHPPNGMHVPRAFTDFLIPSVSSIDSKPGKRSGLINPTKGPHQFLKKAKGRQSLGLALSWIPFTVDKRLPSMIELVGVADLFDDPVKVDSGGNNSETSIQAQSEILLKSLELDLDGPNPNKQSERSYSWREEASALYRPPDASDGFQIMLTRQERRRLAKLEHRLEEEDIECSDPGGVDMAKGKLEAQHQEQDRFSDDEKHPDGDDRPLKRPRLDDYHVTDIIEPPAPQRPRHAKKCVFSDGDETDGPGPGSPGDCLSTDTDNKENWPPLSSSSMFMDELDEAGNENDYVRNWSASYDEDYPMQQQLDDSEEPINWSSNPNVDVNNREDKDNGIFEPLSFSSQYPAPAAAQFPKALNYVQSCMEFAPMDTENENLTHVVRGGGPPIVPPRADDVPLVYQPDIASHSLGISSFAQLRCRKVSESKAIPMSDPAPALVNSALVERPDDEQRGAPPEIFDQDTIVFSETAFTFANSTHRYMVSLDFIQKHALVRALRSEECAVELVERQTLGGVDLILDPDCAIIYLSLFSLPARSDAYIESVLTQSWKFSHMLIIFEAYPEHASRKPKKGLHSSASAGASELYAYTPPIVKAIKKFRRNINMADAFQTKRPETKVQYAFADSVREAALLTRWYGDRAEERDVTSGAIWGERMWLSADFFEGDEQCLGGINGLNHFSASMILSQVSLQDFLNFPPEERSEICVGLIAGDVLAECNADIESRMQRMATSSDIS